MWTVSKGLMLDVMKSTCGPLPSDARLFLITLDGSIVNLLIVHTISNSLFYGHFSICLISDKEYNKIWLLRIGILE